MLLRSSHVTHATTLQVCCRVRQFDGVCCVSRCSLSYDQIHTGFDRKFLKKNLIQQYNALSRGLHTTALCFHYGAGELVQRPRKMFEIAVTSLPFLSFPSWLQSGLHLRAVKQHAIKIEGLGQYEPFHHGLGHAQLPNDSDEHVEQICVPE